MSSSVIVENNPAYIFNIDDLPFWYESLASLLVMNSIHQLLQVLITKSIIIHLLVLYNICRMTNQGLEYDQACIYTHYIAYIHTCMHVCYLHTLRAYIEYIYIYMHIYIHKFIHAYTHTLGQVK